MKNVLFEAGACQDLADARWKRLWNHRLAYSGLRHAEEIGWPQRNSSVEKRAGIVMGVLKGS